jgi:hypothetical protein
LFAFAAKAAGMTALAAVTATDSAASKAVVVVVFVDIILFSISYDQSIGYIGCSECLPSIQI